MRHKYIVRVGGLVLSVVLLYLAMKDLEVKTVLSTLKMIDFWVLSLTLIFIILSCVLGAIKWSRIVGYGVKFNETFVSLLIGLFVNNILPARLGEIARAYVLSKKKAISLPYSISTVLLDRFFDLIGLLGMSFVFFPRAALPPRVSRMLFTFVGLLLLGIAILISASRRAVISKLIRKIAESRKPISDKVMGRIIEIQENLKRINSPESFAILSLIAFFQWFSMSVSLYFVIRSFNVSLDPYYIPFVCALLNMGITVPSSPGYIGLYQFLLTYLLSLFGVPKHEGFSVSIVYHALWYIPYNALGLLFVTVEQIKFKELRELKG